MRSAIRGRLMVMLRKAVHYSRMWAPVAYLRPVFIQDYIPYVVDPVSDAQVSLPRIQESGDPSCCHKDRDSGLQDSGQVSTHALHGC